MVPPAAAADTKGRGGGNGVVEGGVERGEEVEKGGWGNRCVGARGSRKSRMNTKRIKSPAPCISQR